MADVTGATPEQISLVRRLLKEVDDETLGKFLQAYALGEIAGYLVSMMTPEARAGFFSAMRQQFPEAGSSGQN
jgi:hypothetical protein